MVACSLCASERNIVKSTMMEEYYGPIKNKQDILMTPWMFILIFRLITSCSRCHGESRVTNSGEALTKWIGQDETIIHHHRNVVRSVEAINNKYNERSSFSMLLLRVAHFYFLLYIFSLRSCYLLGRFLFLSGIQNLLEWKRSEQDALTFVELAHELDPVETKCMQEGR